MYTVLVTNTGEADGVGLVISDPIPTDTIYVLRSAASNGTLVEGNPIVASLSVLQPGQVLSLTFAVIVNPHPLGSQIDNTAIVTAQNFDPSDPLVTLVVEGYHSYYLPLITRE